MKVAEAFGAVGFAGVELAYLEDERLPLVCELCANKLGVWVEGAEDVVGAEGKRGVEAVLFAAGVDGFAGVPKLNKGLDVDSAVELSLVDADEPKLKPELLAEMFDGVTDVEGANSDLESPSLGFEVLAVGVAVAPKLKGLEAGGAGDCAFVVSGVGVVSLLPAWATGSGVADPNRNGEAATPVDEFVV